MKRFLLGSALILTLAACGGGGTSVSANKYAGTYTGTFSWDGYTNGVHDEGPLTGDAIGTVDADGNAQMDCYIQPNPSYVIDRIKGLISPSTGQQIGTYTYAIKPVGNPNPLVFPQTSTYDLIGNTLTGNTVGTSTAVAGKTYRITMILTRN